VELIAALQTSQSTLERARAYATACGKEVTTSQDVPSFVSNAVLMSFINEAIMALEKGVATKEDIDKTLNSEWPTRWPLCNSLTLSALTHAWPSSKRCTKGPGTASTARPFC